MATAIEFNNISKLYRLGLVSTGTLAHDLKRWWTINMLRKEDPYLKIGEVNDRSAKGESDYVWALKDIDFKVEQGDVVGIIGKNGAGKSTLLKILSKITAPTTGTIKARGRIGSLLEVGTGFHPEMTGRENIYLNGAILGMTKQEIAKKLDEIVDFSGCERYIDTPVKRYSSGMMVRLGFAVAAHLDPEILVVDEVLAVGDAEFQQKAIGKMKDVSRGEGRTVLFVSHNMSSIRKLCQKGVVLKNGRIDYMGTADDCVDFYVGNSISELRDYAEINDAHRCYEYVGKEIEIRSARLLGDVNNYASNQPLELVIRLKKNKPIQQITMEVMINDARDERIGSYLSPIMDIADVPLGEEFEWKVQMEHNLAKGKYHVCFNVGLKNVAIGTRDFDVVHNVLAFNVSYSDAENQTPFAYWPDFNGNLYFKGKSEVTK